MKVAAPFNLLRTDRAARAWLLPSAADILAPALYTFVYTRQQLTDTHLRSLAAVQGINGKAALHLKGLKLRDKAVYIFELVLVGVIRESKVADNHLCRQGSTLR